MTESEVVCQACNACVPAGAAQYTNQGVLLCWSCTAQAFTTAVRDGAPRAAPLNPSARAMRGLLAGVVVGSFFAATQANDLSVGFCIFVLGFALSVGHSGDARRILPKMMLLILPACARLDPKVAVGSYKNAECGYSCGHIAVFENGCAEVWSGGEGALPKLRGRWQVDSAQCIRIDLFSPESQGYVQFDNDVFDGIKTSLLCFDDGNNIEQRIRLKYYWVLGYEPEQPFIVKYVRAPNAGDGGLGAENATCR